MPRKTSIYNGSKFKDFMSKTFFWSSRISSLIAIAFLRWYCDGWFQQEHDRVDLIQHLIFPEAYLIGLIISWSASKVGLITAAGSILISTVIMVVQTENLSLIDFLFYLIVSIPVFLFWLSYKFNKN